MAIAETQSILRTFGSGFLCKLPLLIQEWLDALCYALLAANNANECMNLLHQGNCAHVRGLSAVATQSSQRHRRIRSEQYSVATQLEVLRLQPSALIEPVLDVGCGHDARLVKHLRSRDINAIGIDLFCREVPGCLVSDWFQFPWLRDQFGTIIAHLSFSLHFLHQHL